MENLVFAKMDIGMIIQINYVNLVITLAVNVLVVMVKINVLTVMPYIKGKLKN